MFNEILQKIPTLLEYINIFDNIFFRKTRWDKDNS